MESSLGRLTECGGERGYKHNLFPSCTMSIVSMLTYLFLAKSFVWPKNCVGEREDTSTFCSPPVPCWLYQYWHICKKFFFAQKWVWGTESEKIEAQFVFLPPAQHWLCVWYRRVCILHGLCNDKKTNREETGIKDILWCKREKWFN